MPTISVRDNENNRRKRKREDLPIIMIYINITDFVIIS